MGGCKNVKGGNPPLNIPAASQDPTKTIQLPGRASMGVIEPITNPNYYEPRNVIGGALYLHDAVSSSVCDAIPRNGDYKGIIGNLADGSGQVYYMSYIELDENTIENPIQDGGSTAFGGSADVSLMDGFYCSSAAKNFKNGK